MQLLTTELSLLWIVLRTACSSASLLTRTSTEPAIVLKSSCQKWALINSKTPSTVEASEISLKI